MGIKLIVGLSLLVINLNLLPAAQRPVAMVRTIAINRAQQAAKLHAAIRTDLVYLVRRVLEEPGTDVNGEDELGNTPLHTAVTLGHPEVVETVLRWPGVNVNAQSGDMRFAPLHAAVRVSGGLNYWQEDDRRTILRMLLDERDIQVNCVTRRATTPLYYAVNALNDKDVWALLGHPDLKVDLMSLNLVKIFNATREVGLMPLAEDQLLNMTRRDKIFDMVNAKAGLAVRVQSSLNKKYY